MKVVAIKKFGKHPPGEEFDLPDKAARLLIRVKKLRAADQEAPAPVVSAPVVAAAPEVVPATYATRHIVAGAPASTTRAPTKRTTTTRTAPTSKD